ncbi:MAG: hypothetical protein ACRDZV_14005, partial [Acidimicrobiia bacterium]
LGIGHSVAYLIGAVVLAIGLSRRTGHAVVPAALVRALLLAAPLGAAAWGLARWWDPHGRLGNLVLLTLAGTIGGGLYLVGVRATGGPALRLRRTPRPSSDVGDLDPDSAEVDA